MIKGEAQVDPDTKAMRVNLMKEMLWNKPAETVELY